MVLAFTDIALSFERKIFVILKRDLYRLNTCDGLSIVFSNSLEVVFEYSVDLGEVPGLGCELPGFVLEDTQFSKVLIVMDIYNEGVRLLMYHGHLALDDKVDVLCLILLHE
jgi:hypothetical protein